MLHCILGGAGSGKSTHMIERISAQAGKDKPVYFITPEQYSFESDRQLYDKLGVRGFNNVKTASFTSIAQGLFTMHGGVAGEYADEPSKLLIMNLAISEVQDKLRLYAKQASSTKFSRTMLDAVSELKIAGITPEELDESAVTLSGTLQDKTAELSLVYQAYNAMLTSSYKDNLDDLTRAAMLASKHQSFLGARIYIDEFKGFTAGEYALLAAMLEQAESVTIALCTENVKDSGVSVFATVNATYRKLIRIAKEVGASIAPDTMLKERPRYRSEAIAHIEANLFRPRRTQLEGDSDDVAVIEAPDIYAEAEYICAQIRSLIMEGYHFRDIAIIGRDMDSYTGALESAFERFEIPAFMDGQDSIQNKSLIMLVTSAFEAATWNTEAILRYLKTGFAGVDLAQVSELENFCFTWDIRGRTWLDDFSLEIAGVKTINSLRSIVVKPLARFAKATEYATGAQITRAVFALLEEIGATQEVARRCDTFAQAGHLDLTHELNQLWDVLITILETMHRVLGDTPMTRKRYLELLRLIIAQTTFASAPQTLDAVTVGSADRIRVAAPKVLFLIGVNEGIIPYAAKSGGIFTDKERQALASQGMELGQSAIERLNEERFVAYKAAATPSQRLYISYALADSAYRARLPSGMVAQICTMLGITPKSTKEQDYKFRCTTPRAAYFTLANMFRSDTTERASLLCALSELVDMPTRIEGLQRALRPAHHVIQNADTAQKLFGTDMQISATRFEDYQKCHFLHFCKSGMRLRPLRKMELSPLERGSVIHYCLSEIVKVQGKDFLCLDKEALSVLVVQTLERYLSEELQGEFAKDVKFLHLYRRLTRVVLDILVRLQQEFLQSEFMPCEFELPIEPGGKVEPVELLTASGQRISVQGVIDRVDIMEKNGNKYVRVVDYKSGKKDFHLSDVYYGLNMQMLLYLFAVWKSGKETFENVLPAGVLYMPAGEPTAALERDADVQQIENERKKGYKMSGIVLNDSTVIEGMEKNVDGVFIPVSKNKNGSYSAYSKLISLEQLGKLHRHAEKMLREMAQDLCGGDIGAVPVNGNGYDPCAYCDYRSVCGRDEKGEVRMIERLRTQDMMDMIAKIHSNTQSDDHKDEEVQ